MEYAAYPALLVVSLGLILFACELFTNGIEWTGKKLDLPEGATGSILAAVGTALPETSIPIIALIAGNQGHDIAVGAIAGAPFMLATLGFFVTGGAVLFFSRKGGRDPVLNAETSLITRDLGFFLVIYTVAFLATFVGARTFRLLIAAGLVLSYVYYTFLTLSHEGGKHGEMEELHLSRAFHLDEAHNGHIAFQVLASLVLIVAGAHFFVVAVEHVSVMLSIPAMLLSLLITPVATELPEKMNSVLWIRDKKDTLAIGNITGAMVFQASFPVAIGVAFTPWNLTGPTLVSAIIAILSAGFCYVTLKIKKTLPPHYLMAGGAFYLAFMAYLFFM